MVIMMCNWCEEFIVVKTQKDCKEGLSYLKGHETKCLIRQEEE